MAASNASAYDKLKEELTCTICMSLYQEPKILPGCNHVYCEGCIKQLVRDLSSYEWIKCPECRTVSKIKKSEIAELKTSWKLRSISEIVVAEGALAESPRHPPSRIQATSRSVQTVSADHVFSFFTKIYEQSKLFGFFILAVFTLITTYLIVRILLYLLPLTHPYILWLLTSVRSMIESVTFALVDRVLIIVPPVMSLVEWFVENVPLGVECIKIQLPKLALWLENYILWLQQCVLEILMWLMPLVLGAVYWLMVFFVVIVTVVMWLAAGIFVGIFALVQLIVQCLLGLFE